MMISAVTLLTLTSALIADFPRFEPQEIDPYAGEVVYAVVTADVNGDKKPDVIALTEDAVLWYENPSWKKHVITQGETARDNVCIQAHDIDGDGRIDFAVGAGWRPTDTTKASTLQWIGRDAEGAWKIHPITYTEPTLHRIRFGKVLGDGKTQLVVAPLQGRGTKAPNWGDGPGVKIQVFSIPNDPTMPDWPSEVASDDHHTAHNIQLVDFLPEGGDEILVASREGVSGIKRGEDHSWHESNFGPLDKDKALFKGAGEIKLGRLESRIVYVATIEPFHGSQVVAYVNQGNGKGGFLRKVLAEPVTWGHALWCADLDGDGDEELIVGQRDPNPDKSKRPIGPGVSVFDPDPVAIPTEFTRHIIDDGGIAVEDLVAEDLDGDSKPEIIAGGRATHNVKIYWNKGK